MKRHITLDPEMRIEGHGKIILNLTDTGQVEKAHLQVISVRDFGDLLEGMELIRMPLITGRICGACTTAHHIAAIVAIERGLGVSLPQRAVALRNLLYLGHMLQSHALSTFLLLGTDVLWENSPDPRKRGIFDVLKMDPKLGKKLLRLKNIGQGTVETVGGRSVHPVAAVPGGMASEPTRSHLHRLAKWGEEALAVLLELLPLVRRKLRALRDIREATTVPMYSLGLSNNGMVDYIDGTIVLLDDHGNEEQWFNGGSCGDFSINHLPPEVDAKPTKPRGNECPRFFVGPLARLNVNRGFTTPRAHQLMQEFHAEGHPRTRMADYVESRIIEMVYCAERMAEIAGSPLPDGALRTEAFVREGRFIGVVEAPRGLLIHDYTADDEGIVKKANLVVATQNNYLAIEETMTSVSRHFLSQNNKHQLRSGIEFVLRLFDPCLACATQTAGKMPLEIEVRQNGASVRS